MLRNGKSAIPQIASILLITSMFLNLFPSED